MFATTKLIVGFPQSPPEKLVALEEGDRLELKGNISSIQGVTITNLNSLSYYCPAGHSAGFTVTRVL